VTSEWRAGLLALDLDGTVLTPDLRIDPRDVAAVGRAQAAGMTVVVCTGRPFPGALPWARRLGLKGALICYQGAEVRSPGGEMLLDRGLEHGVAMEIVRFCRERDLHVQAYRNDELIVERDREEGRRYAQHAGMEMHLVPDLDQAMGPTTPKMVIIAQPPVIEELLPEVRGRWQGRVYAATSSSTYLEITSPGADKRAGLSFLCERIGIPRERTVAVGDGRNDEPMIEWAALGVAMGTAPPEVAAAAGGHVIGAAGTGAIARLIAGLLGEAPMPWDEAA
jgi:Cof subfamily protein (haloacid dehalogenase superfamily)